MINWPCVCIMDPLFACWSHEGKRTCSQSVYVGLGNQTRIMWFWDVCALFSQPHALAPQTHAPRPLGVTQAGPQPGSRQMSPRVPPQASPRSHRWVGWGGAAPSTGRDTPSVFMGRTEWFQMPLLTCWRAAALLICRNIFSSFRLDAFSTLSK